MSEQKKTTPCPLCGEGVLKKGAKMVYCDKYKPRKEDDGEWINQGECDFHIVFNQKHFEKTLTPADIRSLIDGKTLKNKKGDSMVLDLERENGFFCKVEFAPKTEDQDF